MSAIFQFTFPKLWILARRKPFATGILCLFLLVTLLTKASIAQEKCWPIDIDVTTTPVPPQVSTGLYRHENITHEINDIKPAIVLLGDSLIQAWGAARDAFPDQTVFNMGVGGDRTQNILWRLNHTDLTIITPHVVILLVGTNNLIARDLPCAIGSGAKRIVLQLKFVWPSARIVILGVPPMSPKYHLDDARIKLNLQLSGLAKMTDSLFMSLDNVVACDFGSACPYYLPDGVHFTPAGYARIGLEVGKVVGELK